MKLADIKDLDGQFPLRWFIVGEGIESSYIGELSEKQLQAETVLIRCHGETRRASVTELLKYQKELRETFVRIEKCDSLQVYLHLNKIAKLLGPVTGADKSSAWTLMGLRNFWTREAVEKNYKISREIVQKQRRVDPKSKALREALGIEKEQWCIMEDKDLKNYATPLGTMYRCGRTRKIVVPIEVAKNEGAPYTILEGFDHKSVETLTILAEDSKLSLEDLISMTRALECE